MIMVIKKKKFLSLYFFLLSTLDNDRSICFGFKHFFSIYIDDSFYVFTFFTVRSNQLSILLHAAAERCSFFVYFCQQ